MDLSRDDRRPDLREDAGDVLPRSSLPRAQGREIEFREALPKTISGKIRRVDLRAEARGEG